MPTTSRRTRLAFVVFATAGLGLISCGGSGDASTTEGQARSEAEFVKRADQVCADVASDFDELPEPVGGAKPVGLGGFMREWVARLRPLEPPKELAADWRAALDLLDRAADKLDAAEAGDPDAQSEALWSLEPRAQQHIIAMHVPFKICFVE
jgi:hypothetical protein